MKSTKSTVRGFIAPPLPAGSFTPYADASAAAASAGAGQEVQPKILAELIIPAMHRAYWEGIQAKIPSLRDEMAMDLEGDDGDSASGIPSIAPGETMTIHQLFHQTVKDIDVSGSPACIVSDDSKWIRAFFPMNALGTKMSINWLTEIPGPVLQMGRSRNADDATRFASGIMILPSPVHESPVALLMTRTCSAVPRFTDAITSYVNLFIIHKILLEIDTENPEHKSKCEQYRKLLCVRAGEDFYKRVDALYAHLLLVEKTDRPAITNIVIEFARAIEGESSSLYLGGFFTLKQTFRWHTCTFWSMPSWTCGASRTCLGQVS